MTYRLRRLDPSDLGMILRMQERIRDDLPDPSVFQTSTPEFVAYCLDGGGRCYGVVHGTDTVAYRMVYFPREREFNLARDSALPVSEHGSVAHWDTIAVLPHWRGRGLTRLMNTRALADIARTEFRHLFSTTAPTNEAGLRSLLGAGFRPIRLVHKFENRLRFLCYRPARALWSEPTGPRRTIPLLAVAELRAALEDGWVGHGVLDGADGRLLETRHEPYPFRRHHYAPEERSS